MSKVSEIRMPAEDYIPPPPMTLAGSANFDEILNRMVTQGYLDQRLREDALPPLPRYPSPAQRRVYLDFFYQSLPYRYLSSLNRFRQTAHAPGLQVIATLFEGEKRSLDETVGLRELHDTIRAAESFDAKREVAWKPSFEPYSNPYQMFLESLPDIAPRLDEGADAYAHSYGLEEMHWLTLSMLHLKELVPQYDTIIWISRGGLADGYAAYLLGYKPFVWDLHAHDRDTALSHWITPIRREDIEGKRVLLLDKDIVTGDTMAAALEELAPFNPAKVGAYVHYDVKPPGSSSIGSSAEAVERVRAMGIVVHSPREMGLSPLKPLVVELHEKLDTPLGRLRKAVRALDAAIEDAPIDGSRKEVERARLREVQDFYSLLNPLVPGMLEVRDALVSGLEFDARAASDLKELRSLMPMEEPSHFVSSDVRGHLEFKAEALARARYQKAGRDMARQRGIENERFPHSYTAAFAAAERAMGDGYDIALIVGPEGFAWEPIFADLGLPTVALSIPEEEPDGPRTLQLLEDLAVLRGKKVLVIEDDVVSGATLRKVLEAVNPHEPAELGLYLGNSSFYQSLENIPGDFQRGPYVADWNASEDPVRFLRHLTDRQDLFQSAVPPTWFEERLFEPGERAGRVQSRMEEGLRRYLYQTPMKADEWKRLTQIVTERIAKGRAEDVEVAVLGYGRTSGLIGALLALGVNVTAIEALSHGVDLEAPLEAMPQTVLSATELHQKFPQSDGRLKVVDVMEGGKQKYPRFDLIFGITPETSVIQSALTLARPGARVVFQTYPYGAYKADKSTIDGYVARGEFRKAGEWNLSAPLFETTYGEEDLGATVMVLEAVEGEEVPDSEAETLREGPDLGAEQDPVTLPLGVSQAAAGRSIRTPFRGI